jgi:hypothetical protein
MGPDVHFEASPHRESHHPRLTRAGLPLVA